MAIGTELPASWHTFSVFLPDFSGLYLCFPENGSTEKETDSLGMNWQSLCFQTLKEREKEVCLSRLIKAGTIMAPGQVNLKITAILLDTHASQGTQWDNEKDQAGDRVEGRKKSLTFCLQMGYLMATT